MAGKNERDHHHAELASPTAKTRLEQISGWDWITSLRRCSNIQSHSVWLTSQHRRSSPRFTSTSSKAWALLFPATRIRSRSSAWSRTTLRVTSKSWTWRFRRQCPALTMSSTSIRRTWSNESTYTRICFKSCSSWSSSPSTITFASVSRVSTLKNVLPSSSLATKRRRTSQRRWCSGRWTP